MRDDVRVTDNADQRRYEIYLGDTRAGFLSYRAEKDRIVLVHTEIAPELQGGGLGTRLVAAALEDVRARGLSIVPRCPFVVDYIRDHPEAAALVAPNLPDRSHEEHR
jgi:uncharacterized protein